MITATENTGALDQLIPTPTYNFGAGPAMLPREVMHQAQHELLDYQGTGISVLEMNHRSDLFRQIAHQAMTDLRQLYAAPESDYAVVFAQGGASQQFVQIPLNLSERKDVVAYVDSGHWSKRAISFAREVRAVDVVASSANVEYQDVPAIENWLDYSSAAYIHYTPNETIQGLEFSQIPDCGKVPLVADMSSCILSQPLPLSRFGLIYAGAQKNLGPSGVAVIIIRRDLVDRVEHCIPSLFRYRDQVLADSMLNTPPTFAWYLVGLTLAWVRRQGGLTEMDRRAKERSSLIYRTIDESDGFYRNGISNGARSRMNIPFHLAESSLEGKFLELASERGLKQLEGHRVVGGLRASLYNAMEVEGAKALASFMAEFAQRYG